MSDLLALGAQKYVRLTTFRKDGTPVPTPVWITRDGEGLVFITGADSGKVKRMRRDPRVALAPSDARGRVADGVVDAAGRAELVDPGPAFDQAVSLLRRKYGIAWMAIRLMHRFSRHQSVVLRIHPA